MNDSLNNKVSQVKATREGGAVRRGHVLNLVGHYDVAQHSYGAVSLILLLHPSPSLALIKAVQWHDVGERWMGDVPSPAKSMSAQFKSVYEEAEDRVLMKLGLLQLLEGSEAAWLRGVDILELWLFSREEEARGNRMIQECRERCEKALDDLWLGGSLPDQLATFYAIEKCRPHTRLSENFAELLFDGDEPIQA